MSRTKTRKTEAATPAVKVEKPAKGKSLLDKLAKVAPKGRTAADPISAILASIAEMKTWAKSAPFVTLRSKAEKAAAAKAGLLSRSEYVALLDEMKSLVEGCDGKLKTLKPHRERVGQAVYYGARTITSGDFAGSVGFRRPVKGETYASGPRAAGVFSSRVQQA